MKCFRSSYPKLKHYRILHLLPHATPEQDTRVKDESLAGKVDLIKRYMICHKLNIYYRHNNEADHIYFSSMSSCIQFVWGAWKLFEKYSNEQTVAVYFDNLKVLNIF